MLSLIEIAVVSIIPSMKGDSYFSCLMFSRTKMIAPPPLLFLCIKFAMTNSGSIRCSYSLICQISLNSRISYCSKLICLIESQLLTIPLTLLEKTLKAHDC